MKEYDDVDIPDDYGARLLDAVPTSNDPVARELTLQAVAAFRAHDGEIGAAAARVDGLVRRLGTHHARIGTRPEEFALAFAFAHRAAQDGLTAPLATDQPDPRRRITDFVAVLAARATEALQRARARETDGGYTTDDLRGALFGPGTEDAQDLLAASDELDALPAVRVLVAVGGGRRTALPGVLLDLPGAVFGADRSAVAFRAGEALDAALMSVRRRLRTGPQVVIGAPTSWRQAPTSLALVRRAAALLADGTLHAERRIVPYIDLAGAMLMNPDADLTALLVRHHLAPLSALPPIRRMLLGTTLQHWLETNGHGVAADELAELRGLFGPRLEDGAHRVALAVALQLALPEWREEL